MPAVFFVFIFAGHECHLALFRQTRRTCRTPLNLWPLVAARAVQRRPRGLEMAVFGKGSAPARPGQSPLSALLSARVYRVWWVCVLRGGRASRRPRLYSPPRAAPRPGVSVAKWERMREAIAVSRCCRCSRCCRSPGCPLPPPTNPLAASSPAPVPRQAPQPHSLAEPNPVQRIVCVGKAK